MKTNNDFHAVEFFRKVRDEMASEWEGKSDAEIVKFFHEGAMEVLGADFRPAKLSKYNQRENLRAEKQAAQRHP